MKKQSTADVSSTMRRAVGKHSRKETTSSRSTTSLKGSRPMRVDGAWMPHVVTPAQAAARDSVRMSWANGT